MDTADVRPWADVLARLLAPVCLRVEVAGSLRRESPDVKDIEIVAIPRPSEGLFGPATDGPTELDALLPRLVRDGVLAWDSDVRRNGPRYKQLVGVALGLPVDLFLADADNWGNLLALRTGCAAFSQALVTRRAHGGLMPEHLFHRDGRLWSTATDHDGHTSERPVACPDEAAYFKALRLPCLPSPERTPGAAAAMRRELSDWHGRR